MPRKIPWLTESVVKPKETAISSNKPSRPGKRRRVVTPEFEEEVENDFIRAGASSTRERKERAERALSSSPIHSSSEDGPPRTEYMRQGIGADDDWMMVEDEFLATATLFTKHLHHAEYVRLRKLQAETKPLGRPTVQNGTLPTGNKNRLSAEAKAKAQWNAIQKSIGYDGNDFPERSNLRGLTKGPPPSAALPASQKQERSRPRRESSPLQRSQETMTANATTTNQSILAGLAKELDGISASEDSDDLDAPARRRQPTTQSTFRIQQCFGISRVSKTLPLSPPKRPPDPPAPMAWKPSTSSMIPKLEPITSSRLSLKNLRDEAQPPKNPKSSEPMLTEDPNVLTESMSRIAKRRAERAKKQVEEKRNSLLLEEIPTFLV